MLMAAPYPRPTGRTIEAAAEAPAIGMASAARKYGVPASTLRKHMERVGIAYDPRAVRPEIGERDMRLAVLVAVAAPGVPWTQDEIAERWGVSRQYVQAVENRAVRKILEGTDHDLLMELREHLYEK
jgi:hypothetical protein